MYRRALITEFGGPNVLEIVEEKTLPEPGSGQVRIKVLAAGVAFTDTMIRKGKYPDVKKDPPFTPGYDMVGIIDKLGPDVDNFTVGQKVADMTVIGAHSEYICLEAERLVVVPEDLEPDQAVALVLAYVTAHQMLHRIAKVQPGEIILVHGAGGGVGTALVQLAKIANLDVFGTDSASKLDLVEKLGAIPIDYQKQDFVKTINDETPAGVDAVFDPIGGAHLKRSFSALAKGGRLVGYGFYNAIIGEGGSIPVDFLRLNFWNLFPNQRSATFYSIEPLRKKHPDWFSQDLNHLFQLAVAGKIKPIIWKRYPLDQLAEAHRIIDNAKSKGKIIITFDAEH